MRRECQAQFLQEDKITTLCVAIQRLATLWPCLAQFGVEWYRNAKCTKRMHGNISP